MSQMIRPAPVRRSVTVNAPRERAFAIFTHDIGRWWPASHHIGKAALKTVTVEPRAGGRWYEVDEDGAECDWGKVLAWEPPARVLLAWQLTLKFEYDPNFQSEVEVRFTEAGEGRTLVELEHRLDPYGDEAQAVADAVGAPAGWQAILEQYAQVAQA